MGTASAPARSIRGAISLQFALRGLRSTRTAGDDDATDEGKAELNLLQKTDRGAPDRDEQALCFPVPTGEALDVPVAIQLHELCDVSRSTHELGLHPAEAELSLARGRAPPGRRHRPAPRA